MPGMGMLALEGGRTDPWGWAALLGGATELHVVPGGTVTHMVTIEDVNTLGIRVPFGSDGSKADNNVPGGTTIHDRGASVVAALEGTVVPEGGAAALGRAVPVATLLGMTVLGNPEDGGTTVLGSPEDGGMPPEGDPPVAGAGTEGGPTVLPVDGMPPEGGDPPVAGAGADGGTPPVAGAGTEGGPKVLPVDGMPPEGGDPPVAGAGTEGGPTVLPVDGMPPEGGYPPVAGAGTEGGPTVLPVDGMPAVGGAKVPVGATAAETEVGRAPGMIVPPGICWKPFGTAVPVGWRTGPNSDATPAIAPW
jgi:hypothetical protein